MSNDIDLSSIDNWTAIGKSSSMFSGTFDGNGHVIKNLTINNPTSDYQGLFGYASSGEIKNIGTDRKPLWVLTDSNVNFNVNVRESVREVVRDNG